MEWRKYDLPENIKECIILAEKHALISKEYLQQLDQAEELALRQGESFLRMLILSDKAYHYYLNANVDKAIQCTKQAVTVAIHINNRKELARFYCNLSSFFIHKMHLEKAIECSFEALKLNPDDVKKQTVYMNLGVIFRKKKEYKQALEYLNKAVEINQKSQDKGVGLCYLYSNIGNIYLDSKNYESSIVNFKKAISYFSDKENVMSKLIALEGIGEALLNQQKFQQAIDYFQHAMLIAEDKKMHVNISHLTYNMGKSHKALKHYQKAITIFEKAITIAKKYELKEQLLLILNDLQQTHCLNGDIHSAYAIQGELLREKDVLFEALQKQKLDKLMHKKEQEIDVLKEQNEQIKQQNKRIKQQNTELKQYAHIIAHDLQEPLRNINGFSTLLKYRCVKELSGTSKEYLNFLIRSSEQMHQQLNDLLKYVTVDNSKNAFEKVDLNKVLEKALFSLQKEIQEAKATVNYTNLPSLFAHEAQLQQLFYQIIHNALKFRHKDRNCSIDIQSEIDNGFCSITVQDNGIGIQKEYLKKIFILFNRVDKKKYKGTGVGLPICQKIVHNHNGTIKALSNENNGTCISFTLKLEEIF